MLRILRVTISTRLQQIIVPMGTWTMMAHKSIILENQEILESFPMVTQKEYGYGLWERVQEASTMWGGWGKSTSGWFPPRNARARPRGRLLESDHWTELRQHSKCLSANSANINIMLWYGLRDLGSYAVYIYSNNRENILHVTLISNIIAKSDITDVQEINKIDRGKILIEVNSAAAANRLVENSVFIKHNFHAFIPAFKVLRTSIIQDPQQIHIDTLRNHLESNCRGQKSWICKD